jgi:hypothetical protein
MTHSRPSTVHLFDNDISVPELEEVQLVGFPRGGRPPRSTIGSQ